MLQRSPRITTLCFHGVGRPRATLEEGEDRFWIEPRRFAEILDVIAAHPEPVHLTFDDGNESDHRYGLPELSARGLTAEFFVIAQRIDESGSLSRSQLNELAAFGGHVGNHGLTHVPWREARAAQGLDAEIRSAGTLIEDLVQRPVTRAACPRGSYDRGVLDYLRALGYDRAYTVDEGTSPDGAWLRHRYTITRHDTAETVAARLRDPDGPLLTAVRRRARQTLKRWR